MASGFGKFLKSKDFWIIIAFFVLVKILIFSPGIRLMNNSPKYLRAYDDKSGAINYNKYGIILNGWDSNWYIGIAINGYVYGNIDSSLGKTNIVFFPLYPMVIRGLNFFVGNYFWSGVVVSNVFLLLSTFALYYFVRLKFNRDVALKASILFIAFPINFIFSAVQSESLFLFLLILSFIFIEKKKFYYAAASGFLLALTKYIGFLIFIPILYKVLEEIKAKRIKRKVLAILFSIAPFLGFLLFSTFLYIKTGNLSAIFDAEKGWNKSFTLSLLSFANLFKGIGGIHYIYDIVISIVILILGVAGAVILGKEYLLMITIFILSYIFTSSANWHILSFPRYFSILFPAYVFLGIAAKLNRYIYYLTILVFLALQYLAYSYWLLGIPVPM